MRRLKSGPTALAIFTLGLLTSVIPVAAQGTREMQVHFGELSYRLYCSGCHGSDGRGNAAAARALGVPMGDLTLIRAQSDGVFPVEDLKRAIGGVTEIAGHSDLAMHPWAQMFAEDFARFAAEAAINPMVARRIDHLVAYLESIQRELDAHQPDLEPEQ